ncbi:hypothetical protein BpHYR1_033542 [Brachionus plicatilis]|uniref:Uncharacterized protein n=1 Tax=Brachionus plicatilis TaxID=10195 RepID=A0A3M7QEC5_BRAPC|nr:hypothetical protein BpHYR1_033542 [Brachionus plicatilis]
MIYKSFNYQKSAHLAEQFELLNCDVGVAISDIDDTINIIKFDPNDDSLFDIQSIPKITSESHKHITNCFIISKKSTSKNVINRNFDSKTFNNIVINNNKSAPISSGEFKV